MIVLACLVSAVLLSASPRLGRFSMEASLYGLSSSSLLLTTAIYFYYNLRLFIFKIDFLEDVDIYNTLYYIKYNFKI